MWHFWRFARRIWDRSWSGEQQPQGDRSGIGGYVGGSSSVRGGKEGGRAATGGTGGTGGVRAVEGR